MQWGHSPVLLLLALCLFLPARPKDSCVILGPGQASTACCDGAAETRCVDKVHTVGTAGAASGAAAAAGDVDASASAKFVTWTSRRVLSTRYRFRSLQCYGTYAPALCFCCSFSCQILDVYPSFKTGTKTNSFIQLLATTLLKNPAVVIDEGND